MTKTDTEAKTNWNQMQTGVDRIHLTFTGHYLWWQCKVHEAGQVHVMDQNEDEAMGEENEDEARGGEN